MRSRCATRRPRGADRRHAHRRRTAIRPRRATRRISCSICAVSLYNYPGKILWSSVRLRPDGTVTGCRETRGWAPDRKLCFAMRFSAPLTGHAFVSTEKDVAYKGFQGPGRGSDAWPNGRAARWSRASISARLTRPLEVKVAISSVDEAGAIANLASEPGDFDAVRAKTKAAWSSALDVLKIEAPAPMRKKRRDRALPQPARTIGRGRCRRPLSRARQPGASGQGLHLPFDVLAMGYVPRRTPAADLGPAGAARRATSSARWSPAGQTARSAFCRSGSSRAARHGR